MGTDKDIQSNRSMNSDNNISFSIRRCTAEDLEGVIAVNERELPEDYPYFFYKNLLDNFPESFLVACSNDGEIIGYIMWRVEKMPSINSLRLVNKGHLVSLAVFQEHRRRGIATALLRNSMPAIKKQGIIEYVLEVRVSNYNAINLYKKLNFKIDGIKKRYYRDGENAHYMSLKNEES
jgi:ribosomal-protein-alanine N-acetyltransferase